MIRTDKSEISREERRTYPHYFLEMLTVERFKDMLILAKYFVTTSMSGQGWVEFSQLV